MLTEKKLTRRTFLKSGTAVTLGAALFPAIIPSKALGRDGHVAPSNRITLASIGLGGQGRHNTNALMHLPEVQVLALCDVDQNHLELAASQVNEFYAARNDSGSYSGCDLYGDFREILARNDIDTVMLAPPDHWHPAMSVAAAKAGKDIYCEKPLANSIPEGRKVVEAVQRYGRVFQTGSHERSRDNARFACELVRNGRIGKLHTIRVNLPVDHGNILEYDPMPVPEWFDYDMWLGPAPFAPYTEKRCHFHFRYILDYSGGEMTDRGAHVIDLAQLGNNTDHTGPVEIKASGFFPSEGLYNTAISYRFELKYANGVRLLGSSSGPRGVGFEGDAGKIFIHVHGGNLEAEPVSLLREIIGPDEEHLGRNRGHHIDFIEAVKSRRITKAPAEVGHRSATICHMINIAMKLNRPLQWDPDKEQFITDDEANRFMVPSVRAPWQV